MNLSREFSISVGWLPGEEDEAEEQRELTPEQLRMVEEIVGRQIGSITGRVEEVLQNQNMLTAEQSARVSGTDCRANTVTVEARVMVCCTFTP